jgi:hypothetical protein
MRNTKITTIVWYTPSMTVWFRLGRSLPRNEIIADISTICAKYERWLKKKNPTRSVKPVITKYAIGETKKASNSLLQIAQMLRI